MPSSSHHTRFPRGTALAHVIDRNGVTVIEDTTVAAMTLDGSTAMLADHCRTATVVSTGR